MAMTMHSKNTMAEPMLEMNMTPLIDVMLVLIIMMIITIPKQNHAINLTMPHGGETAEKPPVVTIEIDFDGTVSWNGTLVGNRAELEKRMATVAAAATPTTVQVHPNKLASYKSVAAVMAIAQRAHVANLGVTGNEQFI